MSFINNKISIIIPIYNGGQFIDKCVQSVLNQTYGDLQLILVDDGSQDDSLGLCYNWAKKDNRVKVIARENGGVSAARNTGLEHITGEYLLFLDVDDYLIDDKIFEKAILCLKNSFDMVVYGWYNNQNGNHNIGSNVKKQTALSSVEVSMRILKDFSNTACGGGYLWNKIWKLDKFYNNNIPIPKFNVNSFVYEDMEWILDTLYNLETVCLFPDIGYMYNIRSGSLSHNTDKDMQIKTETINMFANLCRKWKNYNNDIYKALTSRYYKSILNAARYAHKKKCKDLKKSTKKLLRKNFFKILFNKDLSYKDNIKLFLYGMF